MKTYENYLKFIHSVIDNYDKFLRKYKISYLPINITESNIIIDDITLIKNSKYYEITYNDSGTEKYTNINKNIDMNVLNILIKYQSVLLSVEYLLKHNFHSHVFIELLKQNIDDLERLIENYKYFEIYDSDEDVKTFNSYKFQDLLFSKSEKISLFFLEHIYSSYNQTTEKLYKIKVNTKTIDKYPEVIEKFNKLSKSKRFNL
jgi:hypothetical protein